MTGKENEGMLEESSIEEAKKLSQGHASVRVKAGNRGKLGKPY